MYYEFWILLNSESLYWLLLAIISNLILILSIFKLHVDRFYSTLQLLRGEAQVTVVMIPLHLCVHKDMTFLYLKSLTQATRTSSLLSFIILSLSFLKIVLFGEWHDNLHLKLSPVSLCFISFKISSTYFPSPHMQYVPDIFIPHKQDLCTNLSVS